MPSKPAAHARAQRSLRSLHYAAPAPAPADYSHQSSSQPGDAPTRRDAMALPFSQPSSSLDSGFLLSRARALSYQIFISKPCNVRVRRPSFNFYNILILFYALTKRRDDDDDESIEHARIMRTMRGAAVCPLHAYAGPCNVGVSARAANCPSSCSVCHPPLCYPIPLPPPLGRRLASNGVHASHIPSPAQPQK